MSSGLQKNPKIDRWSAKKIPKFDFSENQYHVPQHSQTLPNTIKNVLKHINDIFKKWFQKKKSASHFFFSLLFYVFLLYFAIF